MTEYFKLPDSMDTEELKKYFLEFLDYYTNSTSKNNIVYVLEELMELADRQWHTYELLDSDVKYQIEEYIMKILDFHNEEVVDTVLCIVPRVGLEKTFKYIQQQKKYIVNDEILKNIVEAEKEYGEHVGDPYYGMENH